MDDTDNEELQKCLIDIAEISPKFLKSVLDHVFEMCISVIIKYFSYYLLKRFFSQLEFLHNR